MVEADGLLIDPAGKGATHDAEVAVAVAIGHPHDPATGNTTKIRYNKMRIEVENADEYLKLYVYLFPSKIKSYQRISGKGGKFDYNLNDGMIYDLAVVGINENGYNYFQKMSVKGGDLGKVKL